MCFPWHHGGFSMATFDYQRGITCCALLRIAAPLFSTRAPQGLQGLQGLWAFWTKHPLQGPQPPDMSPRQKASDHRKFHLICSSYCGCLWNNFFLALMSMGACAASVASASRIDGWKWGVFGWLWDGENAMRQQDRWSHHRDKCNSLITLLFFLMCLFHHLAADKCHEKWWHPHEAIGWVQTSMKRSWPPWPLWPLGSTMPGQRICGGDWNRAPGVKSRRGAGWPPGSSDSICRTSDYVYIFIYIYIKFITHTYIYIYAYVLRCVVLKMYILKKYTGLTFIIILTLGLHPYMSLSHCLVGERGGKLQAPISFHFGYINANNWYDHAIPPLFCSSKEIFVHTDSYLNAPIP